MTELKTLKDIDNSFIDGHKCLQTLTNESFCFHKELKAEAVKWAKFYSRETGVLAWILMFFNLTEDDLK